MQTTYFRNCQKQSQFACIAQRPRRHNGPISVLSTVKFDLQYIPMRCPAATGAPGLFDTIIKRLIGRARP
jgi:hypothetical protein